MFSKHWTIDPLLAYQLGQCQALVSSLKSMPLLPDEYARMLSITLRKGAHSTTAIEGNTLTQEDIDDIYDRKMELPESKAYLKIEVDNILNAFNKIKNNAVDGDERALSKELIQEFHRDVAANLGEFIDAIPGRFRTDNRTVGKYRPPNHEHVDLLIGNLCEWLVKEFHYPKYTYWYECIIQAIAAHVYFEWIHPFGDGNGRTGRLIEFYILVRAGLPVIASTLLSNFYNATRSEYYRQFDVARQEKDLTKFLRYAVGGLRDGLESIYTDALGSVKRITWQHLIYEKFRDIPASSAAVSKRRQRLALTLKLGKDYSLDELAVANIILMKAYRDTVRTLARDVNELIKMKLIVENKDKTYRTNHELLLFTRLPEAKAT
ncbi:MAG: Fic family protein [Ignavibacteria bacterium]|nr:Fic family protein [Ignavibacteria bacterium]